MLLIAVVSAMTSTHGFSRPDTLSVPPTRPAITLPRKQEMLAAPQAAVATTPPVWQSLLFKNSMLPFGCSSFYTYKATLDEQYAPFADPFSAHVPCQYLPVPPT
ncbi:MAG TPA: hypothetical protein VMA98_06190 [Candidatus Acidoferrales bacterium]|nr:hypothetical protein [Candidatus Acidoferrales bacterium]